MPQSDEGDEEDVIVDCVDDPIVAHPYPKGISTAKCARRWGSGIAGEKRDHSTDAIVLRPIDLPECSKCRRSKLDSVWTYFQPRSACTWLQGMFGPSSANAASKASTS